MPGAEIGAGAEIEPGSVVTGAGARRGALGGLPRRRSASAGERLAGDGAPAPPRDRACGGPCTASGWRSRALLPLLAAAVPGV